MRTSTYQADIVLTYDGKVIMEDNAAISPVNVYKRTCVIDGIQDDTKLTVKVLENGRELVAYTPEKQEIPELPKPAEAIGEPWSIQTMKSCILLVCILSSIVMQLICQIRIIWKH